MSTLADQWLEVFRAGDYGAKGKFTEQDLRAIASSYDPSLHEAPVVIGRPEMNAPAFGWVEKLRADGGTLLAKLRQVQPALEDMVSRGLFKKRSIALYPKFEATGTPYLRHIGFLGAMPPEVTGLAEVRFNNNFSSSAAHVVFDGDFLGEQEHGAMRHVNQTSSIKLDPASGAFAERIRRRAIDRGVEFGVAMKELTAEENDTMKFNSCGGSIALDVRSGAIAEAAKERARERNVTFAEAVSQINQEDTMRAALSRAARSINVDPQSVIFAEAAQRRAGADGISYGEALTLVYAEAAPFARADGMKREILVAAIDNGQVILNAGAAAGLTVGTRLSVHRLDREITDPASTQVIRKTYLPLGEITITKLDDLSADAKGASAEQLKVGDVAT
ncbi:MAG: hypothetical protein LAN64_20630, partial [Acidobacteriia bacterium]|nr:hypothetical protein [Terriglobia bacterium]